MLSDMRPGAGYLNAQQNAFLSWYAPALRKDTLTSKRSCVCKVTLTTLSADCVTKRNDLCQI